MSDFNKKCGPNATDEYDQASKSWDNTYHRTHFVKGSGIITTNNASNSSVYYETYHICSGITELGDNCLSQYSICSISLPDTLKKIGTSCFRKSKITSVSLPDSLEEIGHTNFPTNLSSITIPSKIKDFPTDNLQDCTELSAIAVDKDNKFYRSIDGILYDYDITEILLCPRAKSGKVIIPNTVKRIAHNCFKNCKKLTAIEIPRSIDDIGDYAFSGLKLDRLIIPNTVKSIGVGCFAHTVINKTFRFTQGVVKLPPLCFKNAIIPSIDFLKCIEVIGEHCFDIDTKNDTLPEYLVLSKIKHIGEFAFSNVKKIKVFEFSSNLSYIGDSAFNSTADDLKIICLSLVPFKLPDGAFRGISDNATLFIPKGTKVIYENMLPWSTFTKIEEFDMDRDLCDEARTVSDEHMYSRLNSIVNSVKNFDRIYLKEMLYDIAQSYQYVDNEVDYEVAMSLIRYNHRFNPVLIPNLEKTICSNWINKYKLRFLSTCLFNTFSTPIALPIQDSIESKSIGELHLLPSENIETLHIIQDKTEEVDVHCADILRFLQNELSLAEKNIKIAVSWFTNFALFKQIKELAHKGLDIRLIINNDSVNNSGYCLNFNELIQAGVHISLVEYPHLIHHKFCIIDNKIVINGSYNWTRFSEKNYENIMIFRNNDYVVQSFDEEFEKIHKYAEHKDVDTMPMSVPKRPEYDRNAFIQYITEELDAEARETSDQRDKIKALHKAAELNPEYFYRLNPKAKEILPEAIEVVKDSDTITKNIVAMVKGEPLSSTEPTLVSNSGPIPDTHSTNIVNQSSPRPVVTKEEKTIVDGIKATDLFMVLDVSGSMQNTYTSGHVYSITKKVVSTALTVSASQEVSLWRFGDSSSFVNNINVSNLQDINNVKCLNSGTKLNSFIISANSLIKGNSLVIIFTDDDGGSINGAVAGMKNRSDVFWQIIVYGSHKCITSAIDGIPNISLVNMTDYDSKNDLEVTQAILKDYINWKK